MAITFRICEPKIWLIHYVIQYGGRGEAKRLHYMAGGRMGAREGPKKDDVVYEQSLIQYTKK